MCILFMYLNDKPEQCPYKLIVASNRDEYWDRPTEQAAFRGDRQQWIGGIDLEPGREGGTWLGLSKTGKFAVLLNILSKQRPDMKGRGHWVTEFVQGDVSCEDYMKSISASMDQCNAFQFLCTDLSNTPGTIHYISNRGENRHTPRQFVGGIHSCDNSSDYETPWKKRVAGQKVFSKIVNECKSSEKEKVVSSLIDLLSDKTQHGPDPQLALQFEESGRPVDTEFMKQRSAVHVWSSHQQYSSSEGSSPASEGPPQEQQTSDVERARNTTLMNLNSSIFVWAPTVKYGNRTNTEILVDFDGNCDYFERTLETPVDLENPKYSTVSFKFKLEVAKCVL